MVEVQRDAAAMRGDVDVSYDASYLVQLLHDAGPLLLRELGDDPVVAEWEHERVEDAVVSAWSQGLIFIDAHDLIVAL